MTKRCAEPVIGIQEETPTIFVNTGNDAMTPVEQSVRVIDNHIYYYRDVEYDSIMELNSGLRVAALAALHFDFAAGIKGTPVHVHVHSYGGSLLAGFAALDTIQGLGVPVHTHIEGGAASAATLISMAGTHRTIGRYSFILIHQLRGEMWGRFDVMKEDMENNIVLMGKMMDFYASRSKITRKQLAKMLAHDFWFTAETALKHGLVDEIV
jgi:ATP-dependent protease ClpP protease subunit